MSGIRSKGSIGLLITLCLALVTAPALAVAGPGRNIQHPAHGWHALVKEIVPWFEIFGHRTGRDPQVPAPGSAKSAQSIAPSCRALDSDEQDSAAKEHGDHNPPNGLGESIAPNG